MINKIQFKTLILFQMAAILFAPLAFSSNNTKQDVSTTAGSLAEALNFLYNHQYNDALPLLQKIDPQAQSLDLMFWIGNCAAKTEQYDLAIDKYKQMLAINPALHRVRLELAEAYYKSGRLNQARDEFKKVKVSSAPEIVKRGIERRLARIDRKAQKIRLGFLLSTGYQYDDNISSGPDDGQIQTSFGTLILDSKEKKLSSSNYLTRIRGDLYYDFGRPNGLIWFGKVDLFDSHNLDYSDFHFRYADIATGPTWAMKKMRLSLPVGYTDLRYGDRPLSTILHVDPGVEYYFKKYLSLFGGYTYALEDYTKEGYNGYDNDWHLVKAGTNIRLYNGEHIISPMATMGWRKAETDSASYNALGLSCSYFAKLPRSLEFSLNYQWLNPKYEDNPPLFTADREDKRHYVNASLKWRFYKYLFTSLGYTYINNDSNSDLYDFEKNMVTLSIGVEGSTASEQK